VSSEWQYAHADDPALEFRTFLPHERDHEYQLEHLGGVFIVRTNWQAKNFRLMQVPIGQNGDRAGWRDVVPHRDDTFIEDFDVFNGFLAVSVRSGGLAKNLHRHPGRAAARCRAAQRRVARNPSSRATRLPMPRRYRSNAELDTEIVRYAYSSLTNADHHLRLHVSGTGEKILLKRDPVVGSFDPANYRTEFLFAMARDRHANSRIAGVPQRPGPGRFRAAAAIRLRSVRSVHRPELFIGAPQPDRPRFIYAIAHVRGGQEMGRAWYDNGRKLHKMNSFADFIDVTRHLVAERYAAKDKVFAMGGSAGGLLMGAIANLSPDDYRGIVAQVPFVDVVTTMLDE